MANNLCQVSMGPWHHRRVCGNPVKGQNDAREWKCGVHLGADKRRATNYAKWDENRREEARALARAIDIAARFNAAIGLQGMTHGGGVNLAFPVDDIEAWLDAQDRDRQNTTDYAKEIGALWDAQRMAVTRVHGVHKIVWIREYRRLHPNADIHEALEAWEAWLDATHPEGG